MQFNIILKHCIWDKWWFNNRKKNCVDIFAKAQQEKVKIKKLLEMDYYNDDNSE